MNVLILHTMYLYCGAFSFASKCYNHHVFSQIMSPLSNEKETAIPCWKSGKIKGEAKCMRESSSGYIEEEVNVMLMQRRFLPLAHLVLFKWVTVCIFYYSRQHMNVYFRATYGAHLPIQSVSHRASPSRLIACKNSCNFHIKSWHKPISALFLNGHCAHLSEAYTSLFSFLNNVDIYMYICVYLIV